MLNLDMSCFGNSVDPDCISFLNDLCDFFFSFSSFLIVHRQHIDKGRLLEKIEISQLSFLQ